MQQKNTRLIKQCKIKLIVKLINYNKMNLANSSGHSMARPLAGRLARILANDENGARIFGALLMGPGEEWIGTF
jgi:hypothetical protein